MRVLVNGLLSHHSGKTSLVRAILQRARREGRKMAGFKPVSSHDYWEHYDHTLTCEAFGVLASRDASLMRELMVDPPDIQILNPYHQLLCPLDPVKALQAGEYYFEERPPFILAERLTHPKRGTTLFLNARHDLSIARREFLDALERSAKTVVPFQKSPVAEGLAEVETATRAAFESLQGAWQDMVVESFSDITSPISFEIADLDVVVSVGGPVVILTEPTEVMRVQEIVRGQRMRPLLRYLKPFGVYRVPHLTAEERADPEALQAAYSELLDALWHHFKPLP